MKQGASRGRAATATHFARESHLDAMARLARIDPLEFRLKHLKDAQARGSQAAAKQFGWGRNRPAAKHGFGLACGTEKGSYVATCAETSVDRTTGNIEVIRPSDGLRVRAVLNPDHLKNQIEGAVMMGLGGALFEHIRFADGKILNPRLSSYRVPGFSDLPRLETVLVNLQWTWPPPEPGETPIVAGAPVDRQRDLQCKPEVRLEVAADGRRMRIQSVRARARFEKSGAKVTLTATRLRTGTGREWGK